MHFSPLVERAIALARQFNATTVLVEDNGGVGTALVDRMKAAGLSAIPRRPVGDKLARYSIQASKVQAQRLYLPHQAP